MLKIRKYRNRRFWLLGNRKAKGNHGRYIAMRDIADMIRAGQNFYIVRYPEGTDITRQILLDLVKTQELESPTLSIERLRELVAGKTSLSLRSLTNMTPEQNKMGKHL